MNLQSELLKKLFKNEIDLVLKHFSEEIDFEISSFTKKLILEKDIEQVQVLQEQIKLLRDSKRELLADPLGFELYDLMKHNISVSSDLITKLITPVSKTNDINYFFNVPTKTESVDINKLVKRIASGINPYEVRM